MADAGREIGLAHLSLLHLDPAELVLVAAAAGFDFVGIRVRPATPTEVWPSMQPGSPASRETLQALEDTGLRVRDLEFLALGADTGREDWMPALEAGAALGAVTFTVAGADPDHARLGDTLAALVADAAAYGITPALEAISYQAVATVPEALALARAAGAHLMIDPLHVQRGGSTTAQVAEVPGELLPVLQLCDGPAAVPVDLEVPQPLPRGMSAAGDPRSLESRALRLAPGEGAFDVDGLLRAAPAGTPVSLEVPDARRAAQLGDVGWAAHLLASTRTLLAGLEEGSRA